MERALRWEPCPGATRFQMDAAREDAARCDVVENTPIPAEPNLGKAQPEGLQYKSQRQVRRRSA